MLVVAPPQLAPAKLVQFLKGRSSRMLQRDFQHLRKRYWGQHLWARGYFCATVGAVDEKTRLRGFMTRRRSREKFVAAGARGGNMLPNLGWPKRKSRIRVKRCSGLINAPFTCG
jgi:hypothetical protein